MVSAVLGVAATWESKGCSEGRGAAGFKAADHWFEGGRARLYRNRLIVGIAKISIGPGTKDPGSADPFGKSIGSVWPRPYKFPMAVH